MSKLDSVPNIDKIIVIWNNPNSSYLPDKNSWCKTIAPKFFIKTKSNSLNNKFLPYDIIKTEAVLTLDDGQSVYQHLVLYLFEVWKQHKNFIVGYYRRFGVIKGIINYSPTENRQTNCHQNGRNSPATRNKPNIAFGVEHQLSLIKKLINFNYTRLSLNKKHYKN
uniref:Glyco_transf_64 domain-containing protein n=1 Tax=Strongyloides papillosus TaxID=174720 RepID=A0A0N5CIK6_STREA